VLSVFIPFMEPSIFMPFMVLFFAVVVFLTSVIPHFGHLPGLSLMTSGCIGHVYTVLVAVSVLLFDWLFLALWANEVIVPNDTVANRTATVKNSFTVFIF